MQNLLFNPFGFLNDWFNFIPKFTYFLCVTLMSLIDVMQLGVRKLAGLDTYYVGDSETAQTGDIALSFIRSIFESESQFPAIKNAFWALVVLGVILLIVTTIIAIIRQEYMPDADSAKEKPSNNKMIIVSRSIRSLFMFLIVPFSVLFGLMLSDVLLMGLDKVTTGGDAGSSLFQVENIRSKLVGESTNGEDGDVSYVYYDIFFSIAPATSTTTFSGMMFKTAAFNANRVRISGEYYELITQTTEDAVTNFNIFNMGGTRENTAQLIDEAFANNVKLANPDTLNLSVPVPSVNPSIFGASGTITRFSKYNVGLIWYYYDLWQFNFLVGFAFLVVCIKLFVNIIIALMKRLIEMVGLFLVSPPIIALMPLDGGKGFGKWRESFMSKALSAYGAIIGMNLFFLILPYINMIKFFPEVADATLAVGEYSINALAMVNLIISSLFIIVGLVSVEGFIGLVSGLIGGEDLAKTGGEMVGKVGDTVAKAGKFTGAVAGVATAPARLVGKVTGVNKLAKNAGKSVSNAAKKLVMGKKNFAKAQAAADSKWKKEGAQKAHSEYLSQNTDYNADMTSAYNSTKKAGQSYDDWLKTGDGQRASSASIASRGLKSLSDFQAGKLDGKEFKAARAAKAANDQEAINSQYTETLSNRDSFVSGVGGFLFDASGLQNISAYSSVFLSELKSATQRNNKQGFKSMLLAFQGKTAKEIELQEIYKRVEDEERAKAQIQKEQRKKEEANKK